MEPQAEIQITETPKIFKILADINAEVKAITKERKNKEQGYSFRGIDDVYNELHELFAKHRVIILPTFLTGTREERQTRSGGIMSYSINDYKFQFTADDGSYCEIILRGEGMDTSDKGTNKAFSAALKYALMSMFLIPTDEVKDADFETPETKWEKPKPVQMEKIKKPMQPERFTKFIDQLKIQETKKDFDAIAKLARDNFSFTEEQLETLTTWEDESQNLPL